MMENMIKILKNEEYEFYGIRFDDYNYSVGDTCNISHELFQDPMYDEDDELVFPEGTGFYEGYYDAGELNGTSCVMVNLENIERVLNETQYLGKYIYLIAGNSCEKGNDIGELIIEDAVVLYKSENE